MYGCRPILVVNDWSMKESYEPLTISTRAGAWLVRVAVVATAVLSRHLYLAGCDSCLFAEILVNELVEVEIP